ncbi:MAG: universal stress protein [Eggerthellales bacterium]|nr:universal stress protein [Eggerthellales bacterium]
MFKDIMVVFDETPLAPKAVKTAIDVAQHYDATLHIVHVNVVGAGLKSHALESDSLTEVLEDSGNRVMNLAVDIVKDYDVKYETHVIEAPSVVNALVNFAKKNEMDLVVVASRGLGLLRQAMGSVSHSILEDAPMPVLIVK